MGGSRKEIGFTKQIDHKQIELGELKTSLAEAASGLLWTFMERRLEPAEKVRACREGLSLQREKVLVCRGRRLEPAEKAWA